MYRIWLQTLVLIGLLFVYAACEPAIGDECETNLDCPAGTFCDTTSPAGYCTLALCNDSNVCPDESACVEFDRFNAFCMAKCSGSGDCREGYVCRMDFGDERFCYVATPEGEAPFVPAVP